MDINPIDLLIGSAAMPPIIALLNQRQWAAQVKALVALAACLLMALLIEYLRGPLEISEWRDTALVVAGTAFASYRLWWQPSGIAPAVEDATTLAPESERGQHSAQPEQ